MELISQCKNSTTESSCATAANQRIYIISVTYMAESILQSMHMPAKTVGIIVKLAYLYEKAFTPAAVWDKPSIHWYLRANQVVGPDPTTEREKRDKLLILGLWQRRNHCIINVWLTNLNPHSQLNMIPDQCLTGHKKAKKAIPERLPRKKQELSPFIVFTSGVFGWETTSTLKFFICSLQQNCIARCQKICSMWNHTST